MSVILLLPWIVFAFLPLKKYMYYVLIVFSIVMMCFDVTSVIQSIGIFLPERYQFYLNSAFVSERSLMGLLKVIFPIILMFIFLETTDLHKCKLKDRILLNLLLFSICLGILFPGNLLILRIIWYFELVPLILIPIIYNRLNTSQNKVYFALFTGNYCLCYFIMYFLIRNNNEIFPYSFNFEILGLSTLLFVFVCLCVFEILVLLYLILAKYIKV